MTKPKKFLIFQDEDIKEEWAMPAIVDAPSEIDAITLYCNNAQPSDFFRRMLHGMPSEIIWMFGAGEDKPFEEEVKEFFKDNPIYENLYLKHFHRADKENKKFMKDFPEEMVIAASRIDAWNQVNSLTVIDMSDFLFIREEQ